MAPYFLFQMLCIQVTEHMISFEHLYGHQLQDLDLVVQYTMKQHIITWMKKVNGVLCVNHLVVSKQDNLACCQ